MIIVVIIVHLFMFMTMDLLGSTTCSNELQHPERVQEMMQGSVQGSMLKDKSAASPTQNMDTLKLSAYRRINIMHDHLRISCTAAHPVAIPRTRHTFLVRRTTQALSVASKQSRLPYTPYEVISQFYCAHNHLRMIMFLSNLTSVLEQPGNIF